MNTQVTEEYQDGFSMTTIIGAIFVGIIMMPATVYLGLMAGQSLGPAAEWVTIILFAEMARRSLGQLKKQEIFILYYVAAGLTGSMAGIIIQAPADHSFQALIWKQYLRVSPQAKNFGIADQIPTWAIPKEGSEALINRDLSDPAFYTPILLVIVMYVLFRLSWIGMGYILFRLTSDRERLPFPLASIAAAGATALAEDPGDKQSWRWRWFSTGAMVGIAFGALYIGLPAITGLFTSRPMMILPIPWADFTTDIEGILPSAIATLSFDLGALIIAMVLPLPLVIGIAIGSLSSALMINPILQHFGFFPTWRPGGGVIATRISTDFDFWISMGIGLGISLAIIGFAQLARTFRPRKGGPLPESLKPLPPPKGRGDFPILVAVGMVLLSTLGYIILCRHLIPLFPLWLLIFYAFIWTPINSYVDARLRGTTGFGFGIPWVKEGTILMSGYKGVDVWFAPLPLGNHGWAAQFFKEFELTKTKFTSMFKAELLMFPLAMISGYVFCSFFWTLAPIPSATYPFVARMWPIFAFGQSLFISGTSEGMTWLLDAIKPTIIAAGGITGLSIFGLCSLASLPLPFFYGLIGGLGGFPSAVPFQIAGVLLRKYYFAKKYGVERWSQYAPVLAAGFACGTGLIGMLAVGLTLILKAVINLPY